MPKDTINNMPLHKKIKDYAEEAKKDFSTEENS